MTLTHLPTRFSDFVNQPIGFVSAAEGFVFMSALLLARVYTRELNQDEPGVRAKIWKRSFKIYGYHLAMLVLLFTVAAAFAPISVTRSASNSTISRPRFSSANSSVANTRVGRARSMSRSRP